MFWGPSCFLPSKIPEYLLQSMRDSLVDDETQLKRDICLILSRCNDVFEDRKTDRHRGHFPVVQACLEDPGALESTLDKYSSLNSTNYWMMDLPIGPCGPLTVFPIGPYKNTVIQQGSFFFVTQVAKCNKGLSYPFSFFSFLSFRTCVHTVTWRVILSPKRKELILRLALTGIINLQNLCGEKT